MPEATRPLVATATESAIRAATRVFRGWRDTWLLVARKPAGWRPAEQPPPSFDLNRGRLGHWDR